MLILPSVLIVVLWFVFLLIRALVRRFRYIKFVSLVFAGAITVAGVLLYLLHMTQPFPHASAILLLSGIGMPLSDFASWASGGHLRIWGNFSKILFVFVSLLTTFIFMTNPEITTEFLVALIALNAILVTGECAVYAATIGPVAELLFFLRPDFARLLDELSRGAPEVLYLRSSLNRATDVLTYASEGVFIFPAVLLPSSAAIFALLALLHFEWFGLWVMMSFWLTIWHPIFVPSYFTVLVYASRRTRFNLQVTQRAEVLNTEP